MTSLLQIPADGAMRASAIARDAARQSARHDVRRSGGVMRVAVLSRAGTCVARLLSPAGADRAEIRDATEQVLGHRRRTARPALTLVRGGLD